ncbi:putative ABC transporter domain-containing protein [Desulfonema limicola]|uniref:ABC transporter domain-containing protein n=1 Tax=Desulfonema limicola TaxID=45656 RepID=A0A975GEV7_9BACT|nr:putative ABC transporter domain-containing protein [Desulfonema limicola]
MLIYVWFKQCSGIWLKILIFCRGLILVLVILVLINIIFSRVNLRWDMTEDKLYSLSEGTKNILADMEQDVVIKYFILQIMKILLCI